MMHATRIARVQCFSAGAIFVAAASELADVQAPAALLAGLAGGAAILFLSLKAGFVR